MSELPEMLNLMDLDDVVQVYVDVPDDEYATFVRYSNGERSVTGFPTEEEADIETHAAGMRRGVVYAATVCIC